MVGGLLIEGNSFPELYINAVLPEEGTYHSVAENDQLERFKIIEGKLEENNSNRFVVFSNQERIMIIDNNLTYLNIISEGILQLLKNLKAQFGDVFLRVIIANRVDTTTGLEPGKSIVQQSEYEKRLKEKLLIASLNNSIKESEWALQTSSARKDKRLMLADIICNTFYTRGKKKKFSSEERAYIDSIYTDKEKTLIFTVFESVLEKQFRTNLIENRIGEAVASICLSTNRETLESCFLLLDSRLSNCGVHEIDFQYKFIEAYIGYYVNVARDFELCNIYLNNLLDYYIPLLKKYYPEHYAERLVLDIKFYLLTVNTHTGNVSEAKRIENECGGLISNLPTSLDTINYKIKFENRRIINLINSFDYDEALARVNELIRKCGEIKELLSLISDVKPYHYDEYAKALGTRLQLKRLMLRKDRSLYSSAKKDSDEAILEFTNQSDRQRQFIYRTLLEIEEGNYDDALHYLKLTAGLEDTAAIRELWEVLEPGSVFAICAFVKLMADSEKWEPANEMYSVFSTSSFLQNLEKEANPAYPAHVIIWKSAYYYAKNHLMNAALKHYKKAVDICFYTNDLTLNIIGIGIGFEMMAMMLSNGGGQINNYKKQLRKKWNAIVSDGYKSTLLNVFGTVDFDSEDADYYLSKSKNITY